MESPFRAEHGEGVVTPEQLSDYLHVTGPGVWAILAASLLVLAGVLAWSMVGTLEVTADAFVVVRGRVATVVVEDARPPQDGMLVRVPDLAEFEIASTETNDYGTVVGYAEVDLADGMYEDAEVVLHRVEPITFLLESR